MSKATTVKGVLQAARWILKHKGWCQGSYAQNVEGQSVGLDNPNMACLCISGAIQVIDADYALYFEARDLLEKTIEEDTGKPTRIIPWNDSIYRNKEQVLALFDKAISKADAHE